LAELCAAAAGAQAAGAAKGLAEAVAAVLAASDVEAAENNAVEAAGRALDIVDRCLRVGGPGFLGALSREAGFFSALSVWLRRRSSGSASHSGRAAAGSSPTSSAPGSLGGSAAAVSRGLQLSREWADLFVPQREEMPEFQQLYRDVRREVQGFPGDACWGALETKDLNKLKGVKENLGMLRELHEANKKTVSQAGRAFTVHATLNGSLTQNLCGQCSQARAFVAEGLERALSETQGEGASPAELLTLLDEIDDLLPKLGWREGIPQRSKGARRRSVTCLSGPGSSEHPARTPVRKRLSNFWLEDTEISEAMLDQHIGQGAAAELELWEEPRPGKALLVLDLDFTLADFTPFTLPDGTFELEDPEAIKRPHVEEFLAGAYRDFDLCVWSRTSPEALEAKLDLLGWLDHPDFAWALVLDKTHMLEVAVGMRGAPSVLNSPVKPLGVIWAFCEAHCDGVWGPLNTLHVDDTPLNFLLNPRSGLTCSVWEAPDEDTFHSEGFEDPDTELQALGLYLSCTLDEANGEVGARDHNGWELQGEALLRQHASTLQTGEAGAGAEGAAPQVPR